MKHKHPMTGIWGESLKNVKNEKYTIRICVMVKKMRNAHGRIWKMARKLKNFEDEIHTLFHMECGEKY